MSKKTLGPNRVLHKSVCDCSTCQELRDGTSCEQCGGPVLVIESETTFSRKCQHCGAAGTVPKATL